MYVMIVERVREYNIDVEGDCKVRVNYPLQTDVGAKRLLLRLFTVHVGGTPP